MNISEAQIPLVRTYFFIRIWAAPATIALFAMVGWFFGMQNAVLPLVLTIVINVVNIISSYYMVHILGWGIAGVAWGTVLAQYIGLLACQRYIDHQTIITVKKLNDYFVTQLILNNNNEFYHY